MVCKKIKTENKNPEEGSETTEAGVGTGESRDGNGDTDDDEQVILLATKMKKTRISTTATTTTTTMMKTTSQSAAAVAAAVRTSRHFYGRSSASLSLTAGYAIRTTEATSAA